MLYVQAAILNLPQKYLPILLDESHGPIHIGMGFLLSLKAYERPTLYMDDGTDCLLHLH